MVFFPPYTPESAALRFPDAVLLWQALCALHLWLNEGKNAKDVADEFGVSRRTLYRLYERWKKDGIDGLWPIRPTDTVLRPSPSTLRKLLDSVGRLTVFRFGALPECAQLLPSIYDPLRRGRILSGIIERAIDLLPANEGISLIDLVRRHYLKRETIAEILKDTPISQSTAFRYLNHALNTMCARWPTHFTSEIPLTDWQGFDIGSRLLGREDSYDELMKGLEERHYVQLIGLTGVGKTTLIAHLSSRWRNAGWNVCWTQLNKNDFDLTGSWLGSVHAQLAQFGALTSATPDVHQTRHEQLQTVQNALKGLPLLLVVDDAHSLDKAVELKRFIRETIERTHGRLKVILCGQSSAYEQIPSITLGGLTQHASRELYERLSHKTTKAPLMLYGATKGNPKLIQLLARQEIERDDHISITAFIIPIIKQLSPEARLLLGWLYWWDGGIRVNHPFLAKLLPNQQALVQLTHRCLVTQSGETVFIHDLVREHLSEASDPMEWAKIRQEVFLFARLNGFWGVAYRTAHTPSDRHAVAFKAAQEATDKSDYHLAAVWWECAYRDAEKDTPAYFEAFYARIDSDLQVSRVEEALDALMQITPPAHLLPLHLYYQTCLYREMGNYLDALEVLHQLMNTPNDDLELAWLISFERVVLHWGMGDYHQANAVFDSLLFPPNPSFLNSYYQVGGLLARDRLDFKKYREFTNRRIQVMRSMNSPYLRCEAALSKVSFLQWTQQPVRALIVLKRVSETIDPAWLSLNWIASQQYFYLNLSLTNINEATRWLTTFKAVTAEMGGFYSEIGIQQGLLAMTQKDLVSAAEHFSRAAAYYEENLHHDFMTTALHLLAKVRLLEKDTIKTKKLLDRLLGEQRVRPMPSEILGFHLTWGDYAASCGDYPRAMRHYVYAEKGFKRLSLNVSAAELRGRQAEVLAAEGQLESAARLCAEAISLLNRISPNLSVVHRILLLQSDIAERLGHHDHADSIGHMIRRLEKRFYVST
jgi:tetratricopeptide (TPR) repeat protein/type II secretory pathway predicted ATPase ExeA